MKQLLVHHPNDFAVQSNFMSLLEQGHESFVEVYGTVLTCTNEVLGLPVNQRDCLLPSDLGRNFYRQPNCMLGCIRNKIYELCRCHPYQMPPPILNPESRLRDCVTTDAACFMQHMSKTILCLSFDKT